VAYYLGPAQLLVLTTTFRVTLSVRRFRQDALFKHTVSEDRVGFTKPLEIQRVQEVPGVFSNSCLGRRLGLSSRARLRSAQSHLEEKTPMWRLAFLMYILPIVLDHTVIFQESAVRYSRRIELSGGCPCSCREP